MIDILSTAQIVLREAGYSTRLRAAEHSTVICFEDEELIGFCSTFNGVEEMLSGWRARELSILKRFSASFHEAGDKAWNVYCAFLCGAAGNSEQVRQIRWIEEALERTRKIASCGLAAREDVVRVLLPVLPLQYQPALQVEDSTERLQKRIATLAPRASVAALDESVSPAEVMRLIGEAS